MTTRKTPNRKRNHFERKEAFCSNKLKQAKLRAWEMAADTIHSSV